jgi:hypothetical protein
MSDHDCPTCDHPAVQHLLVGVPGNGIAVCKICGAKAFTDGDGFRRCDFEAVMKAVERAIPGSTKPLDR